MWFSSVAGVTDPGPRVQGTRGPASSVAGVTDPGPRVQGTRGPASLRPATEDAAENRSRATCVKRPRICSHARTAAVPFKSVLADAAVGEVLWFFSVEVGITR